MFTSAFRKALLWLSLLSSAAGAADSNGWISSGGDLFGYSKNPWWLENTSEVRYCVAVDESGVSASAAKISELSRRALEYWKGEFANSYLGTDVMGFTLRIATQNFVEAPCDGREDLKIQVGYGTLDSEQIDYLKEPAKMAAVSVRTYYDEVAMKGRGFIYVASDQGPKRYDGGRDLIENAWQYDGLLYLVLLHELGHVFGLPHMGQPPVPTTLQGPSLMTENFADLVLTANRRGISLQDLKTLRDYGPFFQPRPTIEVCHLSEAAKRFFGVSPQAACLEIKRIGFLEFSVFERDSDRERELGRIGLKCAAEVSVLYEFRSALQIRVPTNQKALSLPSDFNYALASSYGPTFTDLDYPAVFEMVGGRTQRSAHLRVGPGLFRFEGVLDGDLVQVTGGMR